MPIHRPPVSSYQIAFQGPGEHVAEEIYAETLRSRRRRRQLENSHALFDWDSDSEVPAAVPLEGKKFHCRGNNLVQPEIEILADGWSHKDMVRRRAGDVEVKVIESSGCTEECSNQQGVLSEEIQEPIKSNVEGKVKPTIKKKKKRKNQQNTKARNGPGKMNPGSSPALTPSEKCRQGSKESGKNSVCIRNEATKKQSRRSSQKKKPPFVLYGSGSDNHEYNKYKTTFNVRAAREVHPSAMRAAANAETLKFVSLSSPWLSHLSMLVEGSHDRPKLIERMLNVQVPAPLPKVQKAVDAVRQVYEHDAEESRLDSGPPWEISGFQQPFSVLGCTTNARTGSCSANEFATAPAPGHERRAGIGRPSPRSAYKSAKAEIDGWHTEYNTHFQSWDVQGQQRHVISLDKGPRLVSCDSFRTYERREGSQKAWR